MVHMRVGAPRYRLAGISAVCTRGRRPKPAFWRNQVCLWLWETHGSAGKARDTRPPPPSPHPAGNRSSALARRADVSSRTAPPAKLRRWVLWALAGVGRTKPVPARRLTAANLQRHRSPPRRGQRRCPPSLACPAGCPRLQPPLHLLPPPAPAGSSGGFGLGEGVPAPPASPPRPFHPRRSGSRSALGSSFSTAEAAPGRGTGWGRGGL